MDDVDAEHLAKPRRWQLDQIRRCIFYVRPISSNFDFVTFSVLLWGFGCWNPARASWPLTLTMLLIILVAILLPGFPLAAPLNFVPLPLAYWPALAAIVLTYCAMVQLVKGRLMHHP